MSENRVDAAVLDVLGREAARNILVQASTSAVSAEEVATQNDISLPTAYRRIDELCDADLLDEHRHVDPDGNHYSVYTTNIRRLELELVDGSLRIELDFKNESMGPFANFWETLGGGVPTRSVPDE